MSSERFRGVSPSSASGARSVTHCRPTRFRDWWSLFCANSFGLWQQCPGWPPGLLGPATPVSAERGCAVDLSPVAIRPHLRRAGRPRFPERIEFTIAVLTYKVIHGLAPGYLGPFTRRVADLPSRRSLYFVSTNRLVMPRLSTVGSQFFFRSPARRHGMTARKT